MFKNTLKQDSNRMMLRHILRQCVTAKYGPDPDKLIIERLSREWQAMEQKASIFCDCQHGEFEYDGHDLLWQIPINPGR